jgi:predicted phosphodiesterase
LSFKRVVFISDTHNREDFHVPGGDVVIHCGDATMNGGLTEIDAFALWFARLPHRHKVFVAGNHDWGFATRATLRQSRKSLARSGAIYLEDSSTVIDGLKIYGSPWQPWFHSWAFNFSPGEAGRAEAKERWAKIPADVDVLVTHGPAWGILDKNALGQHCGCRDLLERVKVVNPTVHASGHIHPSHGVAREGQTLFVNASICAQGYRPTQCAIVVDYFGKGNAALV